MTKDNKDQKDNKNQAEDRNQESLNYEMLIKNSVKFQSLKNQCIVATKLSLTGITNLVVNYEDPCLVDCFLRSCFKSNELYGETFDMDAVELQQGRPGQGLAAAYIDELIFGSCETKEEDGGGGFGPSYKTDAQTGKRKRQPDGFINRKDVMTGEFIDRFLIIKNVDFCLDFCQQTPGKIEPQALWIFDNFRNPSTKKGCSILLVSNEPLKFPFKIRTIKFEAIDEFEANDIIDGLIRVYQKGGYAVEFNESQRKQVVRKLCGLTYTEAGDVFAEAMSTKTESKKNEINCAKVVKNLRETVNARLMQDANGLTHLISKPWEDYICPESSNFTYDVRKIVRDFKEIDLMKEDAKKLILAKKDDSIVQKNIDAIRSRMPHVIILYGKGGVGKSAFPIHFAGLLEFDVWDFNVNASHSKWIGEGSERMRDALNKISKGSHLVVRVDEYDRAMGATSSSGAGMHEAHKQVESEFMNWLQNSQEDNFFVKNDVFFVLTTNHKDNITGPLLRSGRADLVIDIDEFDEESMKKTFLSAPRRMEHRGIPIVGYETQEKLLDAIKKLDLSKLATLASMKGFTVRDIDVLLQEMAAHDYYYRKGKKGLAWTSEVFIRVLENSTGSIRGENTSELRLGDRALIEESNNKIDDPQGKFSFDKEVDNSFNEKDFLDGIEGFKA